MNLSILKPCQRLVLLLSVAFHYSFAQDAAMSVVASPSPSSSTAARYSEVPVDLSTGVPQISMPLYVIESAKLSYPVSISYHASGIKVNDIAGPVGTGWSLNCGGIINRIMRNRPDEQPGGFFSFASAIPSETDPLTLTVKDNLANKVTDMMPDLFYYSTGTMAGKILFDNQLVARSIPRNTLKVTPNSTSTLTTFILSDPGGTNYEFDPGETASTNIPGAGTVTYIASWYLSRIVSADKQDSIRFNYTLNTPYAYTTSENAGINFFYNAPPGASRALHEMNSINSNLNISVTGTRYLSSINYKGGKIVFSFSGGRTDDVNGKKLDQVIIYDKDPVSGVLVENKKINFSYSYFQNTDSGTRLRLDSFREQLNATTFNPPYTFSYSVKQLPAPGSFAQDHWGYYNGANGNTNLIPAYTHGSIVISTNNRNVNENFADGCMLKSITSPLGGVTEFVFEGNKYLSGATDTNGPGLRVSKIIKRDPYTSINSITTYNYLNPASGKSSGVLVNSPSYFTDLAVVDNSHGNLYNYNCLLIKLNATTVGNFPGAPLIYEYVTSYTNDDVNSTGKTVSRFSIYTVPTINFPYFPVDDNSWTAGNLKTQEIYKVQGGVSTIVKKIENTYQVSPYSYTIKGLSSARNKIFFFTDPTVNDFIVKNYYTYSKFEFVSETKIYDYEQNSGTLNSLVTENYFYDKSDIHLFNTKVESTTSQSTDKVRREFTYVADYPSTGVIAVMKNLNMMGLPIDATTSLVRSGTDYITNYQKTEYFEWKPNKVYPKNFYNSKIPLNTLKSAFTANPGNYTRLDSRINAYYDLGIPIEAETMGDKPRSVIIDKSFNRSVAEANVSSADQIAYTGFESRDYGNWKLNNGTTTASQNMILSLGQTFQTIELQTGQTLNYTYSVTRSNGPNPVVVFTQDATTTNVVLLNLSGSGSISLAAGIWNASLVYDFNVTAVSANFTYQRTYPNAPTIVTSQLKTGQRALQLGGVQTVFIDGLPTGTYTVAYYQKGGTVTLTPTGGAAVTSTVTGTAETDGWTKIQKTITIGAITQGIQITGTTAIYIDELRLYPAGAFMSTSSYDINKNIITQTDVNLKSQFMEYDERRRIKAIRDHDKSILQHYDYKLAIN